MHVKRIKHPTAVECFGERRDENSNKPFDRGRDRIAKIRFFFFEGHTVATVGT